MALSSRRLGRLGLELGEIGLGAPLAEEAVVEDPAGRMAADYALKIIYTALRHAADVAGILRSVGNRHFAAPAPVLERT